MQLCTVHIHDALLYSCHFLSMLYMLPCHHYFICIIWFHIHVEQLRVHPADFIGPTLGHACHQNAMWNFWKRSFFSRANQSSGPRAWIGNPEDFRLFDHHVDRIKFTEHFPKIVQIGCQLPHFSWAKGPVSYRYSARCFCWSRLICQHVLGFIFPSKITDIF